MRHGILALALLVGLLSIGLVAGTAIAADQTITILDIGQSGETTDGTIFVADPNPTEPATGTGVFEPFLRVGAGTGALYYKSTENDKTGMQLGYNTDTSEPDINYDTKNGSSWTRSVQMNEITVITIDGMTYIGLSLDANQAGGATTAKNQITITDLQIYVGGAELQYPEYNGGYAVPFDSDNNNLAGYTPVWTLDSATNGDVDVILQASICDSAGQCGSGHGDLTVYVPFDGSGLTGDEYFVLYTEYKGANDGFEEWRFSSAQVPEPGSLLLLGSGILGLAFFRRKMQ